MCLQRGAEGGKLSALLALEVQDEEFVSEHRRLFAVWRTEQPPFNHLIQQPAGPSHSCIWADSGACWPDCQPVHLRTHLSQADI